MSQKIIHGAPEGQDAFVLKQRADDAQRSGAVACHIAMDDVRAQTLMDLLADEGIRAIKIADGQRH